eukprot:scaffold3586_cov164-Amphora_coffeaeformis.AAC.11
MGTIREYEEGMWQLMKKKCSNDLFCRNKQKYNDDERCLRGRQQRRTHASRSNARLNWITVPTSSGVMVSCHGGWKFFTPHRSA